MRHVYVFFITGRAKQSRRRYGLVSWLVRVLTLSPICHCLIGFEGVVLDPGLDGVRYWAPIDGFIRHYPTIYAVFRVPVPYGVNLDHYRPYVGVPQPIFPRLLRLLLMGRGLGRGPWIYDCLSVALACLHAAGVPANQHISTPAGLYRWLRKKGYPYASKVGRTEADFRNAAGHLCLNRMARREGLPDQDAGED